MDLPLLKIGVGCCLCNAPWKSDDFKGWLLFIGCFGLLSPSEPSHRTIVWLVKRPRAGPELSLWLVKITPLPIGQSVLEIFTNQGRHYSDKNVCQIFYYQCFFISLSDLNDQCLLNEAHLFAPEDNAASKFCFIKYLTWTWFKWAILGLRMRSYLPFSLSKPFYKWISLAPFVNSHSELLKRGLNVESTLV